MNPSPDPAAIAFEGDRRIASGDLRDVARAAKAALDRRSDASILVFDGRTSAPIDIDFRGPIDDVLARLPESPRHRAGRRRAARAARSGPSETGRGGARSHAAAAALGLAGAAARWRFGCDPPAGRASAAQRRRQGSSAPGPGSRLSLHGRDGRQPAALRRSDPRAVRARPGAFREIDRRMAR